MVKGHRKEKHSRNILKKIEKGFGGPLDMLKAYMVEKKRVKVCIIICQIGLRAYHQKSF